MRLVRILKQSGYLEEFNRAKLEESIRRAGASEEIAHRVADRITPYEGQPSEEIRKEAAAELEHENSRLATVYLNTRNIRARTSMGVWAGVAKLHEDTLRELEAKPGETASLVVGAHKTQVRIERAATAQPGEMLLSKADLERLGAREGSRVGLRLERRKE